ncbi:hypothetical protein JDV02_001927 [Purpureocillium takamizusanense]|uniref:Glycosyl transferase CAP10 domain-containing protein n=1 Tax=Purpureocillium takamizusanense TaxID=2060973 RepID=A0A9Q8Q991_9HYPO|nr:uncharacterized protein JDV02_001927 [Purpureocillium takamizusanense]UNI15390.1 hypothetical protein JDV02_001927 [Purpureocillium takamizusanense]
MDDTTSTNKHPLRDMDSRPVAAVAGAALLCGALAQRLAARDVELSSEVFAWAALPLLVKIFRQYGLTDGPHSKFAAKPSSPAPPCLSRTATLFALAVTVSACYRSEEHIVVLFPALTPLLLGQIQHSKLLDNTQKSLLSPLALPTSTFFAAVSCFVLLRSNGTGLVSLATCLVVLGLLYASYLALARSQTPGSTTVEVENGEPESCESFDDVDIEEVALPWALRIVPALVVALSIRTFVFQAPNGPWIQMVVVGLFKALSWLLIFKTTRFSPWCIATTIGTFSIAATRSPYIQISGLYAVSHVLLSILSLGQTICLLPWNAKKTRALWALALIPAWPFLANEYDIYISTRLLPGESHPVEELARAARAEFDAMLERQSRNYTAAATEYRRRYGMSPPPGFESWFNYATAHNSPIIDDFDMIHEAVAPFLKLSGKRVRQAMREAVVADSVNLWSCEFKGATGGTTCRNEHRKFDRHIGESLSLALGDVHVRGPIPDAQFLVNHLDEPRVMLPNASESTGHERIEAKHFGHQSAWDVLVGNCPQRQGEHLEGTGQKVLDTYGIPFVTDTQRDKDLCQHHRRRYGRLHGLLASPTSLTVLHGAVPVLSTGALSTMGDVLFPSPAYNESEFLYDESRDVAWDTKHNNLYWAGSTTGGYAVGTDGDLWKSFHRQRFVALAQGLDSRRGGGRHWYLREDRSSSSGADGLPIRRRVASSFLNSRLWDVSFTRIFQCDGRACGAQRSYFRARPWADKDAALRSRLAFDTDGNGISGRFGKLLASRSAPLKQTLLREWHDERLAAWVHYVPVSLGMGELPELVSWLTGSATGRARARAVAVEGREWAARALRAEDRAVYVYRLMLELARVQDPRREAM